MKKRKLPGIINIGILTIITLVVWITLNIVRVIKSEPEFSIPEDILEPINPTLNQPALDKLRESYFIESGSIPEIVYSEPTIPSPQPSLLPTPSEILNSDIPTPQETISP